MPTPLVSVVIPAYQAGRLVGGAISSALTQTYPHVEVVVTDDGSTDETAAVLAGYGDLVRVVTQPNAGLSAARNAAIREARGELVCLLDADDLLLPSHVQTAVDTWLAHGDERAMVTCEAMLLSSAGVIPSRRVLPSGTPAPGRQRSLVLERNFVSVFSVFPRAMWAELGGFDETMRVCEDYDFWARAIYSGHTVLFSTHPTALYRRMAGTLSTQSERMYAGDHQVLEHLRDGFGASMTADERRLLERRLAGPAPHQALADGEAALRAGDARRAAEHFRVAASLLPSDRRVRLKAELLSRFSPLARVYAARLARTDHETGRTIPTEDQTS